MPQERSLAISGVRFFKHGWHIVTRGWQTVCMGHDNTAKRVWLYADGRVELDSPAVRGSHYVPKPEWSEN